jgi:hypothetical protein
LLVRPAKRGSRKFGPLADPGSFASGSEKVANLISENSLAFDPRFEARIVQLLSATEMANPAQDLLLAIWKMFLQPPLEEGRNGEGKPDDSVACELCASFRGSRQDGRDFMVR